MKNKSRKIGYFGITANPPHKGHLGAILEVAGDFDEIWVSVSFIHPFNKPDMADYKHRLFMSREMFERKNGENIKVVEIDRKYHETTSLTPYTYNILTFIKSSGYDVSLLIGEDNIKEGVWEKFFKHKEIEKEFNIVVLKDTKIHSTQIRDEIKNNIKPENMDEKVLDYIEKHGLYGESK